MSEVTFAKTFLSSLDRRPIKLPAEHVSDPRQYPNQSPFILPRQTHPFPRKQAPSSGQQAKQKTVTVTLKPTRSGETVSITGVSLDSSIHDLKTQYAQKTSVQQDKIKVLLNKKPTADLKTLKDLGIDNDVEFSVMIMGGGASTPGAATPSVSSPAVEKADPAASVPTPAAAPPFTASVSGKMDVGEQESMPGSEKAQAQAESSPLPKAAVGGPSGPGALNTSEFWSDLQDFLSQRIRDNEEAEKLTGLFKVAWANQ